MTILLSHRFLAGTLLMISLLPHMFPRSLAYAQTGSYFSRYAEGRVLVDGKEWRAHLDSKTGTIHRLLDLRNRSLSVNFPISNLSGSDKDIVESIARTFLKSNPELLRIPADQIGDAHVMFNGELWSITFYQHYDRIPVLRTQIGFTVDRDGDLISFGVDAHPNIQISSTPTVNAEAALSQALLANDISGHRLLTSPELVIVPIESEDDFDYVLAWKIDASVRDHTSQESHVLFMVDAHTNEVISSGEGGRYMSVKKADDKVGSYQLKSSNNKPTVKYSRVVSSESSRPLENLFGQVTLDSWHEFTDTEQVIAFSNAPVRVYGGSTLIAEQYTDANGNYSFSLDPGTYTVEFTPETPFAVAVENDSLQTPVATQVDDITVDVDLSAQVDFFWEHDQALCNDGQPATNTTDCPARGNAAVLITEMRNYFRSVYVWFPLHDVQVPYSFGAVACSGRSKGTFLEIGSNSARSSDIVYHEYTHNVIYDLYGGVFIEPIATGDIDTEAFAMDEGFADYFAAASNNDSSVGESAPNCDQDPVCLPRQRDVDNSFSMADWDSSCFTNFPNLRGQIISGTVWSLKSSQQLWFDLGSPSNFDQEIDRYVYWALWLSPHATTFTDFFINFIDAVDAHGRPEFDPINDAFCSRGIETGYCSSSKSDAFHEQLAVDETQTASEASLTGFPNPFSSTASLRFSLPEVQTVSLSIHDMTGRRIRVLVNGIKQKGVHSVKLNGSDLSGGVYVARLETEHEVLVQPLVFIK